MRPERHHVPVTAEEFHAMRDRGRAELIEGEVVSMPSVGYVHGRTALNIGARLKAHVDAHELGAVCTDVGFILRRDPDVVRAPDVSFIAAERLEAASHAPGFVPGAPDLAIAVLSPNDAFVDVDAKVQDYLAAGTRRVWVVNPTARRIFVYAPGKPVEIRSANDLIDGEDVLPGFTATVASLLG